MNSEHYVSIFNKILQLTDQNTLIEHVHTITGSRLSNRAVIR